MDQEATRITGGCLCGTVRYEAEVYLRSGYYCHCRTCQRTSGAPAEIAVPVKPGTLRFTAAQPKFYRSSAFAERGFCPQCGARLIYRPISEKFAEYTQSSCGLSRSSGKRRSGQAHLRGNTAALVQVRRWARTGTQRRDAGI